MAKNTQHLKKTRTVDRDGVKTARLKKPQVDAKAAASLAPSSSKTPTPPAPTRVDYAALVSSPGRPRDSRVDQDQRHDWEYRTGLSLDRRTGKATWWEMDSNYSGWTPDEHNGHVVGWSFPEPLAGADKWETFKGVREDLGRLTDSYYTEWDGQNLVARNADNGTDWDALNERIEAAFDGASSGEDWADNQAAAEAEDAEERVTTAVNALVLDGVVSELSFGDDGGAYVTLTDQRTGEEVSDAVDSTNDGTIGHDIRAVVSQLREAVEEYDADAALEDED